MGNYLTFASGEAFTIGVNNATKNWNGKLYYSTDTVSWTEWDGATAIESALHDGEHRVHMRGSGNSTITAGALSKRWVLTGTAILCNGNMETILDYEMVANGEHPVMADGCFRTLFGNCASLITAPKLPATVLAKSCYKGMFKKCPLTRPPELPATELAESCYELMFFADDVNELLRISEIQTDEYQTPYRIPTHGTATYAENCTYRMFGNYDNTDITIDINTTYYGAWEAEESGGEESGSLSFIKFLVSPNFPFLPKNLWGWKPAQKRGGS